MQIPSTFDFFRSSLGFKSLMSGNIFRALLVSPTLRNTPDAGKEESTAGKFLPLFKLPPGHAHIHKLQPFSTYIDFIIRTRGVFLRAFAKYRDDFPGVSCLTLHPQLQTLNPEP